MQKETTPADELALYCLSKVYNRHVKVYTSSYCCPTLHDQFTLSQEEIGNLCDIHLLYMGPGKFAEIKRIQPPAPRMPSSPAPLPSSRVTTISSVTPNKRRSSHRKVTNRGDKCKHANVSMQQSNKKKCNNRCHQLDLPVIPDKAEAVAVTLQSSQADPRSSRYDVRGCVFKHTRSSSKPKREN